MSRSFKLAPMSPMIRGLTIVLLSVPLVLAVLSVVTAQPILGLITFLLILLYAAVWFCCRPIRFVVNTDTLEIVFPVWRRRISLQQMSQGRIIQRDQVQQELGWAVRIGVGGLWGGFGWLWTQRRGWVEFYISQLDDYVWIEGRSGQGILLITPEHPDQFLAAIHPL